MSNDPYLYPIVVVEDEWIALRGLTETVNWEKYGFRLVAYHRNGKDCLDSLEIDAPEVIITDIRMPVMDGLELLREIRRRNVNMIVILLSGHEEFEYVRQGLHEGAASFLRKASIEIDMDEHLPEIRRRLDQRRKNADLSLREQVKNESLLRSEELRKILAGQDTSIREATDRLHTVILVRISATGEPKSDTNILAEVDRQIGVLGIPREIECITLPPQEFALVLSAIGANTTQFESRVHTLTTRIEQILIGICTTHSDYGMAVGVGSVNSGLSSIWQSFNDARRATDLQPPQKMVCICGRIQSLLRPESKKREESSVKLEYLLEKERITTEILAGNHAGLITQLSEIRRRLDSYPRVSLSGFIGEIEEFIGSLYLRLEQWRPEVTLLISPVHTVFERIAGLTTVALLFSEFEKIVLSIGDWVARTQKTPSIKGILAAVQYLEHHLEENPTLSVVADYAGISPSHFSVLFKQAIGMTFSEYLTDLRLERSLTLLKQGINVRRAGEMVGYSDVGHFRKLFTRKFGLTPGQIE